MADEKKEKKVVCKTARRAHSQQVLSYWRGASNQRFSVTFPPMIWILMEGEGDKIKTKQASKRDRTLICLKYLKTNLFGIKTFFTNKFDCTYSKKCWKCPLGSKFFEKVILCTRVHLPLVRVLQPNRSSRSAFISQNPWCWLYSGRWRGLAIFGLPGLECIQRFGNCFFNHL